MKTVQGFIAFVKEQDPDREIDHSGGWRQCAVGDYVSKTEGHPTMGFYRQLRLSAPSLCQILRCPHNHAIPTYGHLQQWLKENPNVSKQ